MNSLIYIKNMTAMEGFEQIAKNELCSTCEENRTTLYIAPLFLCNLQTNNVTVVVYTY
jgi:hypothetical protein